VLIGINLIIVLLGYDQGYVAFEEAALNLKEMLLVLPPIFVLLGLLDVWVKRESGIAWMGDKSGFKGLLLAFLLGSAAAGPLYAAFPITYTMAKKGVSMINILVFLGAWSTLKIPLLLFEFSNMGIKFTLIRLFFNVIAIAFLSWLVKGLMTERDRKAFSEAIEKNDASMA
jgi:uncharacterized membrane protein YraQ (UPF0718 family)